ncbi:MAG: MBL fold metallo-hydrolase [Candidatus Omnitrophica bacterium]|nr:MBL fold metallo-hydrolase [Candidatus Omnitrophota bacterium]
MRIEWLGHACFLLEAEGLKIITDPYQPGSYGGAVGYSDINVSADIVTVSHQHFDHNYIEPFPEAEVVDKEGVFKVKGIEIEGILTFHDETQGSQRGKNLVFIFNLEGLKIAHLGDLGCIPQDLKKLDNLDVVLIPVGGTFTLDAQLATRLIELIKPKITIPMHFKTEKLGFDIEGVDKFIEGKSNVERLDVSSIEVKKEEIPSFNKIIVLKPSR